MSRKTNAAGIALIKRWEGCELKAYQDSVGVWTIGYGHTSAAGAPKVVKGMTITAQQAEDMLKADLGQYEDAVSSAVKVALNDNQFAALVSFTYNLGAGNLRSSTLIKKLNAGDYAGAARQFGVWNKAGGKVLQGLVNRRADEAKLWNSPVDDDKPVDPVLTAPPSTGADNAPVAPEPALPPAIEPAVSFWAALAAALLALFKRSAA